MCPGIDLRPVQGESLKCVFLILLQLLDLLHGNTLHTGPSMQRACCQYGFHSLGAAVDAQRLAGTALKSAPQVGFSCCCSSFPLAY